MNRGHHYPGLVRVEARERFAERVRWFESAEVGRTEYCANQLPRRFEISARALADSRLVLAGEHAQRGVNALALAEGAKPQSIAPRGQARSREQPQEWDGLRACLFLCHEPPQRHEEEAARGRAQLGLLEEAEAPHPVPSGAALERDLDATRAGDDVAQTDPR